MGGAIGIHSQTDGIEAAIPAIVILVIHLIRLFFTFTSGGKRKQKEKPKKN